MYFFENSSEQTYAHPYYPLTRIKNGCKNIFSPFVLEEYFHTLVTQKESTLEMEKDNLVMKDKLVRKLARLHAYSMNFDVEVDATKIDLEILTELYFKLFLIGIDLDIISKKQNDGNIHPYDLLHFSYCMLANANIFLTSDNGFEKLFTTQSGIQKLNPRIKELQVYKLKEIILYQEHFEGPCKRLHI
jgi:hypothetical protein